MKTITKHLSLSTMFSLLVLNFLLGLLLLDGSIYSFLFITFKDNIARVLFIAIGVAMIVVQLGTILLIVLIRREKDTQLSNKDIV